MEQALAKQWQREIADLYRAVQANDRALTGAS
jgi:hypothetical protein